MSIYTGQRIPLSTIFTDADGVVDISGGTIRYDYWLPGNTSATPSGFVAGTIVDGPNGVASGNIPDTVNTDEVGVGNWIVQGNAIIGIDEWPECSTKFKVLARGKTCS
jgi:hypothetical protein